MSLLMQALKKAERNRRDALPDDDEPALPSEMYDRVLALTPDDVLSGRVPPAPEWSLEPLESQYQADAPAGGVGEPIPVLQPAAPAPHDPTPPQARRKADPKREAVARPGAAAGTAAMAALSGLPPGPVHAAGQLAGTPIAPITTIAVDGPLTLMPLDASDTPPDAVELTLTAAPAPEPLTIGDAGKPPGHRAPAKADAPGATDAGSRPAGTGPTHEGLTAPPFAAHAAHSGAPSPGMTGAGARTAYATIPAGADGESQAFAAHRATPAASGAATDIVGEDTARAPVDVAGAGAAHAAANAGLNAQTHTRTHAPAGSVRPDNMAQAGPATNAHGAPPVTPGSAWPGGTAHAGPPANAHSAQSANPGGAWPGSAAPAEPVANAQGAQAANPGSVRPGGTAPAEPAANAQGAQAANPGSIRPGGTAPAEPATNAQGAQAANPGSARPGGTAPAEPAANAQGVQSANSGNARPGRTPHVGPATSAHGAPPLTPGSAAPAAPAADAHGAQFENPGKPASRNASSDQPPGKKSAGAAARARAAAKAAAEQDRPGRDPARVRLAVLGGILALVAGTLAGVYWYALTSPGPGAKLPPVPMPPPGAPAGPAAIVVAPPPGQPDGLTPPAPDAAQAAAGAANAPSYAGAPHTVPQQPPPHSGSRMPSDDDLQRALQQPGPAAAAGAPPALASQLPRNELPPGYVAPPSAAPAASSTPAAPAPPATPATPPAATDIHVARSATPPRVNPVLQEGYQAFMAGDLATAAQAYAGALRQDPNNRDALLGNAAVAARRNDTATATAGYMRLLELNPSDPDAQAGLLALRPGDSSQSELRLKELLRREPGSGPLEFALGNLYAQQGRWPDAQQAYFRAYTATPDNADYAFNLAVGLDQLNQRKLALTYYQRALDLSRSGPAVFDRNAARRRADQITASLPPPQQPPQAQPQARTQAVPAPGAALAPPPAAPPPAATAAFTPPAPSVPQAAMAADSPVAGADSAARPTGDGAPPGRAGNNGRQP